MGIKNQIALLLIILSSIAPPIGANESAPAKEIIFRGTCDGSAAVAIDKDTLLVAYDESPSLFAFSVNGGLYTGKATLDLGTSMELDLEGATATLQKDSIWWIGSHGLDGDGVCAPARRKLFATNIPNPDLSNFEVLKEPFDLLESLLKSDKISKRLTKEVLRTPPKEGGVNIEGLSVHREKGLMIGFRSPLDGDKGLVGKALLVHVLETEDPKDPFRVESVYLLDLGDRGIRDIAWTGSKYLIVAGNVESGGEFGLYTWDGRSDPKELKSDAVDKLNPEALVESGGAWIVLSDDGKVKRPYSGAADGDSTCDKIRKKPDAGESHSSVYFRGRRLEID